MMKSAASSIHTGTMYNTQLTKDEASIDDENSFIMDHSNKPACSATPRSQQVKWKILTCTFCSGIVTPSSTVLKLT